MAAFGVGPGNFDEGDLSAAARALTGRFVLRNELRFFDHEYDDGAKTLLAGGRLRGGLHGAHPDLINLEVASPRPHTDFRCLYATLLDQWLGFDSRKILGDQFAPLEIFA